MGLKIEAAQRDDWWVVHVRGEIDISTVPELREALESATTAGEHNLIIDLGEVDFLDSTALGLMVETHQRTDELNGTLRIAAPNANVQRVFDLTGLGEMLGVHPTLETALSADRERGQA